MELEESRLSQLPENASASLDDSRLGNQEQFTSRATLISQAYQSKSTCGKALYRIRRALFAGNGAFLLAIMVAILTISTIDWALWKITLNRFHAKHSNTTYAFFVLQIYAVIMISLSFTAMMLSIYVFGTITERQRQFPKIKFLKMSIFDSICSTAASMASPSVAGHLQTLLSQAVLPIIMVTSIIMLGTRYTAYQVFGAVCIITGTLIAAIPGANSKDMSGRTTKLWAICLYASSLLPLAISNTYREYVFKDSQPLDTASPGPKDVVNKSSRDGSGEGLMRRTKGDGSQSPTTASDSSNDSATESTPLGLTKFASNRDQENGGEGYGQYGAGGDDEELYGEGQEVQKDKEPPPRVHIFYMMFWTFLFQFFISLLAFPILTLDVFGGVAWSDMPKQISMGARCFAGFSVPELECEVGIQPGVILVTYCVFNFGLCILRLNLIKHGSALLLQITNALALLFSNIVFSWRFFMGQYTEEYSSYDFLGLIGVFSGFIIFQVGVYYKGIDAQREKLLLAKFQKQQELAQTRDLEAIKASERNQQKVGGQNNKNNNNDNTGHSSTFKPSDNSFAQLPRTQSSLNALDNDGVVVHINEQTPGKSSRF